MLFLSSSLELSTQQNLAEYNNKIKSKNKSEEVEIFMYLIITGTETEYLISKIILWELMCYVFSGRYSFHNFQWQALGIPGL